MPFRASFQVATIWELDAHAFQKAVWGPCADPATRREADLSSGIVEPKMVCGFRARYTSPMPAPLIGEAIPGVIAPALLASIVPAS
jgi:hypothetical protein